MAKTDEENHRDCMQRFIDLANTMKDEDLNINVVSAGLMTASALYTTFVIGGNQGGLTASGIDKVTATFKQQLEQVQRMKKEDAKQ